MNLETSAAFSVVANENLVAAACADGAVRLFHAASLRYEATLPRPPARGEENADTVRLLPTPTNLLVSCDVEITASATAGHKVYPSVVALALPPSGVLVRQLFQYNLFDPFALSFAGSACNRSCIMTAA